VAVFFVVCAVGGGVVFVFVVGGGVLLFVL
jgi:hypothetical protein